MKIVKPLLAKLSRQEDLNFLLTNRIPRRLATEFMGWYSKIEQPLVRDLSIRIWRLFSDLDLSEAKQTKFKSMHDCFTRELKEGARTIDNDANVLALGGRVIGKDLALSIAQVFLGEKFSGVDRHQRRIDKMMNLES